MPKYTTGEIAGLCGVSVRTVQYYDARGILVPSELSEGGRRLYSDDDLKRLQIICFLREVGVSINKIRELFSKKNQERVLSILLDQQAQELREEIAEGEKKLEFVESIKRGLKDIPHFSLESIGDIAYRIKNKKKLNKMHLLTVLSGIPVTAMQWVSLILWITKSDWLLFAIWAGIAIPWGILVSIYYFNRVAFICPECHTVFRTGLKDTFWAYHTPRMRRLTCPECGRKGLCIEVYANKEDKRNG